MVVLERVDDELMTRVSTENLLKDLQSQGVGNFGISIKNISINFEKIQKKIEIPKIIFKKFKQSSLIQLLYLFRILLER